MRGLLFLSMDEPEVIIQLIQKYPRFRPMYEQAYEICRNMERVMELYSEELKIMDRNTVQLMIDELQEQIDVQNEQIYEQKELLNQKDSVIKGQAREIAELKRRLAKKK